MTLGCQLHRPVEGALTDCCRRLLLKLLLPPAAAAWLAVPCWLRLHWMLRWRCRAPDTALQTPAMWQYQGGIVTRRQACTVTQACLADARRTAAAASASCLFRAKGNSVTKGDVRDMLELERYVASNTISDKRHTHVQVLKLMSPYLYCPKEAAPRWSCGQTPHAYLSSSNDENCTGASTAVTSPVLPQRSCPRLFCPTSQHNCTASHHAAA